MSLPHVAVVGAGPMGRLHARTLERLARSRAACVLAGVLDHHPGRGERLAHDLGARAFTGLDELAGACDAAVVAVPASAHLAVASALLDRDLDLLVEKPLALDVDQAQRLVDHARGRDRILQVGHVEWYNPVWRAAVRGVGRLVHAEIERAHPPMRRGLDVDVIQDLMLHDLDWLSRWLAEEIDTIDARGRRGDDGRWGEVEARLRFASGPTVRLRASRLAPAPRRIATFRGEAGEARVDLRTHGGSTGAACDDASVAARDPDPLEVQARDFLEAIAGRRAPQNSGEVGIAALRLVERVRRALDDPADRRGAGPGVASAETAEGQGDDLPRLGR